MDGATLLRAVSWFEPPLRPTKEILLVQSPVSRDRWEWGFLEGKGDLLNRQHRPSRGSC